MARLSTRIHIQDDDMTGYVLPTMVEAFSIKETLVKGDSVRVERIVTDLQRGYCLVDSRRDGRTLHTDFGGDRHTMFMLNSKDLEYRPFHIVHPTYSHTVYRGGFGSWTVDSLAVPTTFDAKVLDYWQMWWRSFVRYQQGTGNNGPEEVFKNVFI